MNRLGPSLATRWIIGIAVGAFFAIPLISTFLYTLRQTDGTLGLERWFALFDPAKSAAIKPIWMGPVSYTHLTLPTSELV